MAATAEVSQKGRPRLHDHPCSFSFHEDAIASCVSARFLGSHCIEWVVIGVTSRALPGRVAIYLGVHGRKITLTLEILC